MYASCSSRHAVNLLNFAERNGIITGWKVLGDLIQLYGSEGTVHVRPEALDRLIERLRTDRSPFAEELPAA